MKRSTCIEKVKAMPKLVIMAMTLALSVSFAIRNTSNDVYAKAVETKEIEVKDNSYPNSVLDMSKINDIEYLKEKFYYVDSKTEISTIDIDVNKFLKEDLSITLDGNKPKVLILHSHSTEMYSDSKDAEGGVEAVGEKLKDILVQQYAIPTIHNMTAFDIVEGKWQPIGAYDRMETEILQILRENPSIEVVIDLHRDGVDESNKLVTTINSKPTAQILFVNGTSKVYKDGVLEPMEELPNDYVYTNLAFSFNMQLTANNLYPTFAKKICVAPYRYSLNMLPKSLLINVGAQTNTQAEAENAVPILAEILAKNILN